MHSMDDRAADFLGEDEPLFAQSDPEWRYVPVRRTAAPAAEPDDGFVAAPQGEPEPLASSVKLQEACADGTFYVVDAPDFDMVFG